jgi:glutamine amidotransferase
MNSRSITIVDYGMGNIWSVLCALKYLNCHAVVSSDPSEIARSEALLLPGVGSFRKAMLTLRETRLDQAILEAVTAKERKIIGICLGMQLLGNRGSEDGESKGLGLIPSATDVFLQNEIGKNKIPHIGFDTVRSAHGARLTHGLPETSDFYFVHSYRMLPDNLTGNTHICSYGIEFLAAYEHNNIFATQFHPEKSQTNGLVLLRNFIAI